MYKSIIIIFFLHYCFKIKHRHKIFIFHLKIFIIFLVDTANIHIMSDKNTVAAFYDPSDLTDLIMVSMHYSLIYMQFLNMQLVKIVSFTGRKN